MPHLSGILHKVGDNPRDSDEAEKANADARDNEGEHGGKRSEAETGPRFVLVGVLDSPGMHPHICFVIGGSCECSF